MYCPGCGTEIAVNETCECGYISSAPPLPTQPGPRPVGPNGPGYTGEDIVKTITTNFNINQLIIMGGCFFLLVSLFLPFISIRTPSIFGISGLSISTSGMSLIFGTAGSLGYFLDLLLPVIAVGLITVLTAINVIKLPNHKLIIVGVALLGLYLALSTLVHIGGTGAGIGVVLYFILWVAVAGAAVMEFRDIRLVSF